MPLFSRLRNWIQRSERWYLTTPDRALDEAYDAALAIRAIEEQHFQGDRISQGAGGYSESSLAYFEAELRKNLKFIRTRLLEFQTSRTTIDITNPSASLYKSLEVGNGYTAADGRILPPAADRVAITLEKLKFIEEVQTRYNLPKAKLKKDALVAYEAPRPIPNPAANPSRPLPNGTTMPPTPANPRADYRNGNGNRDNTKSLRSLIDQQKNIASSNSGERPPDLESITDKTGVLPRSILGTIGRIKRNLDPASAIEAAEIQRLNYAKTFISLRFIFLIISLTLLAQVSTRYLFLGNQFAVGAYIQDRFSMERTGQLFINQEMEERALADVERYERRLQFANRLNLSLDRPTIPAPEIEAKVTQKIQDIAKRYSSYSGDAVKNWIADVVGLIVFCLILVNSQQEVEILKSLLDEIIYGLSDSAKAFIIILLTDVFVGFHSPHGWEVLLEGIAGHFGLPANRNFIFLFIATFPVILDTIFKYWIFRYLNRVSPSAVATYKEMNE
jgi:hypothetical protein